MRFIISTIFAAALLGTIASAVPKRRQQSTFRLERRHDRQRLSLDEPWQWAGLEESDTYDPVVEDAPVAPLVPDLIATREAEIDGTEAEIDETEAEIDGTEAEINETSAEIAETKPHVGDMVIFNENGEVIGVQHVQDQMVTAAGVCHDEDHIASQHRQQKHHKKVEHHKHFAAQALHRGKDHSYHKKASSQNKKASSHCYNKSSSKKHSKRAIVKNKDRSKGKNI
ncbi:hypothetical protein BG000_009522 [Podila horticola]|nr:hypothetical protein BG000_009522 [Podila horticola]